jgi:hypothetical protein
LLHRLLEGLEHPETLVGVVEGVDEVDHRLAGSEGMLA